MTNRPPEAFEDPHIRSVMLELEQMLEAFAEKHGYQHKTLTILAHGDLRLEGRVLGCTCAACRAATMIGLAKMLNNAGGTDQAQSVPGKPL